MAFATHWQFNPRDIDKMTINEFDQFAHTADQIAAEQEKQRRDMDRRARTRR